LDGRVQLDGLDPDAWADEPLLASVAVPAGPVRVRVWPALEPAGGDPAAPAAAGRVRRARRRRGEAGRPVLLAFHGWTDSGEVFGPLAQALGRRWTVVAPDAPGHGGTRWRSGRRYVVDDQVPAGVAVLDALPMVAGRRAPVVVLGHSMGAVPATGVAAARPRSVRHVLLEDPVGTTRRRVGRLERLRDAVHLQALGECEREQAGVERHPAWPADEIGPWARSKGELDLATLRVPAVWGEPLAARLAGVRCPVTLVRGLPARGGIVSAVGAGRVIAACRGGGQVVALDAGHSVRREARTPFVAALAAVLARYDPTDP
jgi:pimeloyl-ACP methyl ester carboxylesterase